MKMLEIIELRMTGKDHDTVEAYLKQFAKQVSSEADKTIKVFTKLNVETDFSIHLVDHTFTLEQNGSALGQHLVSVLKEFGLVNHSIWIEQSTKQAGE